MGSEQSVPRSHEDWKNQMVLIMKGTIPPDIAFSEEEECEFQRNLAYGMYITGGFSLGDRIMETIEMEKKYVGVYQETIKYQPTKRCSGSWYEMFIFLENVILSDKGTHVCPVHDPFDVYKTDILVTQNVFNNDYFETYIWPYLKVKL